MGEKVDLIQSDLISKVTGLFVKVWNSWTCRCFRKMDV